MTKQFVWCLLGVLLVFPFVPLPVAHAQTGAVTLTMDEVPLQPVDGLTVKGITFHFTVGGVASTDAVYHGSNGGQLTYVQDPSLEGNAAGVLTIDFAQPVSGLQFGVVRSTTLPLTPGAVVQVFDAALNPIGTFPVTTQPLVVFSEGLFSSPVSQPISRVVITFPDPTVAARFAIDNLAVRFIDAFQVGYAANLNVGDSVINITNTGSQTYGPGMLTPICVNVYTFSPDEQLVSCCSCPVTPNALVSLSANADLIGNTLTPAHPNSIVVKLIATYNMMTCNAANIPLTGLAAGLEAWRTTVHAQPGTPPFGVTETRFHPAPLSAAELARLASFCGFIQANGSGYGICRSCRLGGLGGVAQ